MLSSTQKFPQLENEYNIALPSSLGTKVKNKSYKKIPLPLHPPTHASFHQTKPNPRTWDHSSWVTEDWAWAMEVALEKGDIEPTSILNSNKKIISFYKAAQ